MTARRGATTATRQAKLTYPKTLTVYVGPRFSAWLDGPGIVRLIDRVGAPKQYDWNRRLWMLPVDRVDDVLALAEHRYRYTVSTQAVDW